MGEQRRSVARVRDHKGIPPRSAEGEDGDVPVTRPRTMRVFIKRDDSDQMTVRYRNSTGWIARKFILAFIWFLLVMVPYFVWGWAAYQKPVLLGAVWFLAFVLVGRWLVVRLGGIGVVVFVFLWFPFGYFILAMLLVGVFMDAESYRSALTEARPLVVPLLWLVVVVTLVHWLCALSGRATVLAAREEVVLKKRVFGISSTSRVPVERILAIATKRPTPRLYGSSGRGSKGALAHVLMVLLFTALFLCFFLRFLFLLAFLPALSLLGRTYPVCISTRRYDLPIGRYLTKYEQLWVAYELRTFMKEIGHPVRHTLYRA